MLNHRPEQFTQPRHQQLAAFERRLFKHLSQYFPGITATLSQHDFHPLFEHGMQRCQQYRFISEPHVYKYFSLMFCFGAEFDQDPELPWAAQILNLNSPTEHRIQRLYHYAFQNLDHALDCYAKHTALLPTHQSGAQSAA